MNLTELLAEVTAITKRPDLEAQTLSAIKSATLKAHQSDFYSKDIFETGIEFDTSEYRQSLDYISIVANFRAFKYLRRVTDEFDETGTFFEIILPEEVLDSYGTNRTDVAYVAGRVLEIRSKVSFSRALLGCYVRPDISTGSYQSWVADQYPYAIVYEAARVVFTQVSDMEQANSHARLVAEEYQVLRNSALADVGY